MFRLASWLFATMFVFQPNFESIVEEAICSYADWNRESQSSLLFSYRRNSDDANLSIRAYEVPLSRSPTEVFQGILRTGSRKLMTRSVVYDGEKLPFSGMPLGNTAERYDVAGNVTVRSLNLRCIVAVQIDYRGTGQRGNVQWHSIDRVGDKRDVEGLARKIIASVAGENSSQRPNATVNGQSMPCRKGAEGKDMVPLASWCSATGISVSTNSRLGTAVFTRNGKPVIIALGARAIKVGPDWRDLGDTIALHDGKWYVPLTALEATGN